MFTSLILKQAKNVDEAQFERFGARGSGIHTNPPEEKSVQNDKARELEEEKKQWVKRKVELPNFDGSDPTSWIARAERFFEVNEVKPELWVDMAFVSIEGVAVH